MVYGKIKKTYNPKQDNIYKLEIFLKNLEHGNKNLQKRKLY